MATPPGTQGLRLPRQDAVTTPKSPSRHLGLLQDQINRSLRAPWCPSFSLAFRMILLLRVSAAMYSNIQDCDEVFNFWEPLHFLDRGFGFQTWEVSPAYAIRSWANILLHLAPVRIPVRILHLDKRQAFFALRIFFALISSLCEAKFYRAVVERVNHRVGKYMLFMLLFSTGMWSASTAFLPSTFAMYTTLLASSYFLETPSKLNSRRTLFTTIFFAMGAIVGWPFSLLLAFPFVLEELFVFGGDRVKPDDFGKWIVGRWIRLFAAGAAAALFFVPVVGIDTLAYSRLSIVPWNIVKYNIFGGSERGPDLYGTSPWHFYILNLILNFNIILPLALLSVPALFITYRVQYKRVGIPTKKADNGEQETSPYTLLATRLSPLYLWFGVLTSQAHKEERFMYPAYPLICFNAAVTLYLLRSWLEVAYTKLTKSPYRATRTSVFRQFTLATLVLTTVISGSRIVALSKYYHAPLDVVYNFQSVELPRLLNATNLLPPPPPPSVSSRDEPLPVDLAPIKQFNLTLCLGKEWYRFPGHYLVPDGIRVEFVKSEFEGLLPRHFDEFDGDRNARFWEREGMKVTPSDLNDLNKEEKSRYVDISSCDYLIDLDFPLNAPSRNEPRYAIDSKTWDRVFCTPFLDAAHTKSLLSRTLWIPWVDKGKEWGDYCVLRNVKRAKKREGSKWQNPWKTVGS